MDFVLYELLPLILNMSLTGSIVIVSVLLFRILLKKTPKIFSYLVWGVVLFRLLCPFTIATAFSFMGLFHAPTTETGMIAYIPQDIVHTQSPSVQTPSPFINDRINERLPQGEEQLVADPLEAPMVISTALWLCGVVVMLIYSIIQFVRLRRKLIGATRLRENIYLADHISSPFVMGVIKPKIYLPSSLTEVEQSFILAHEKHHIKRLDYITRILAFIALTIHWFNPLVWVAFMLSGKDMEMSCDEAVMKKMNTDIRAEYSQSLLRFATGRKFIMATPLAFGEGDTKDRVKNVMKYKKPMIGIVMALTVLVVGIAVILGTNGNGKQSIANLKLGDVDEIQVIMAMGNPDYGAESKRIINESEIENFIDTFNSAVIGRVVSDDDINVGLTSSYVFYKDREIVAKYSFNVNDTNVIWWDGEYRNIVYGNGLKTPYELYEACSSKIFVADENGQEMNLTDINTIADFEAIKIGTEKDKIREQFGEPDGMLSGMYGDVYIVGDKQIVIYYGFENGDSYPVTDVKIGDYTPEKLTHDQAVSRALLEDENRYLHGEYLTEGHIILGYDDSDKDKTKIYALSMTGWYGFENNNFVKTSGTGVIPVVVTLDSKNAIAIEYPQDGSGYAKSIEAMFPKKYHTEIFKGMDSEYESLKQQEQQDAKEYLSKIGRNAKVGDYSDFPHTFLTDMGVSVEVSNKLQDFYKQHNAYSDFIGTTEKIENGVRMVYEMSYDKNQGEIRFVKYEYDTKEAVEQFAFHAITGEIKPKEE